MFQNIKSNVVIPLLGRLGTAAGTALAGYGIGVDTQHQLGLLVTAGGLVVFDLIADWVIRRNAKSGR